MRKLASLFHRAKLYILVAPTCMFLLGVGLNQAVLIANGGKFPTMLNDKGMETFTPDEKGYLDDYHVVMTSGTSLNFLADIFDVGPRVLSVGDFFIFGSEWLGAYAYAAWLTLVLVEINKQRQAQENK